MVEGNDKGGEGRVDSHNADTCIYTSTNVHNKALVKAQRRSSFLSLCLQKQ